jgi:hypothetical protein
MFTFWNIHILFCISLMSYNVIKYILADKKFVSLKLFLLFFFKFQLMSQIVVKKLAYERVVEINGVVRPLYDFFNVVFLRTIFSLSTRFVSSIGILSLTHFITNINLVFLSIRARSHHSIIIPRPISAREAVEGWNPGWYGKGHVLISIFHM